MKKIYILLFTAVFYSNYGQSVIFSENIGAPTAIVAITAHTYQNSAPITFSGTADIRSSTPSDTYAGASGNGCVFLGGTTPAKTFIIGGIDTSNYTNIILSFGHQKGTNAATNELTVSVSTDATNWTPLTYTRASGANTSVWTLITASGTIPATSNLRIKFENPISNIGFRIDDIKLTGELLGTKDNQISGLKLYPNPVTNGKFFINSDSNSEKEIVIFDILGKQVLKATVVESVSVASLKSGAYIIKITEEGKTATRKLVIN